MSASAPSPEQRPESTPPTGTPDRSWSPKLPRQVEEGARTSGSQRAPTAAERRRAGSGAAPRSSGGPRSAAVVAGGAGRTAARPGAGERATAEAASATASPAAAGPARAQARRRTAAQPKPAAVALSRPFGRALFRVLFRLEVRGTDHVPPQGAVLLASNHTGFLDGPLLFALSPRPASFLAKSELFVGPVSRLLGWLGQIPVRRGRPDRGALRAGLGVLASGGALGVFPEGTRGDGELEQVSDGLAYLALRSGAPVVPVAVLGTAEAMPKGSRVPRWRAPVTVAFGEPVRVAVEGDPRARRTVRAAAEQLRLALLAHLRAEAGLRAPGTPSGGASGDQPGRHERNA